MTQAATVGDLLRRQLKKLDRSREELAEAVQVPPSYIDDLIDGTRRPPLPNRTDVYDKMTRFLKLARNQLANCATAERAAMDADGKRKVHPRVLARLFEVCDDGTAEALVRRREQDGNAEMLDLVQRVLDVAQSAVQRTLNDPVALRAAAAHDGTTFAAIRLRVLEFLDKTPDTLTVADVEQFVLPHVGFWEVDLETDVLRVVMKGQEPRDPGRRKPRRSAPPR